MTRRSLLLALFLQGSPKAGFVVTGELSATVQEQQEGYASIGNDFALSAHPKSAVYRPLMALVGTEVRVHVEPA